MIMDARIESLVKSLERNHHRFKDIFIDKDTGKEVEIERDELIAVDTTEEERELMEMNVGSAPAARFYNIGAKVSF